MQEKIRTRTDRLVIPATFIPSFRSLLAEDLGHKNKLLFRVWGGLGDQICAEPTLRFAIEQFTDCEISLVADSPELFSHLKFKRVFNAQFEQPIYENYLVFQTISTPDSLEWEFISHMLTHCVDFCSLHALRCQLPVKSREVYLPVEPPSAEIYELAFNKSEGWKPVVVHPGRHWPSKTFPKDWWDSVLHEMACLGLTPIIIGTDKKKIRDSLTGENRGTVDVDCRNSVDLRDCLTLLETSWLLQKSKVLISNDSMPIHMAAPGNAWIGMIASCKHPDYITHWRKGQWGYKQENLGLGGMWDIIDQNPNATKEVFAEQVDEKTLRTWLPAPATVAAWAYDKYHRD